MNTGAEDPFRYCDAAVRGGDEDRWLAAQYASPLVRRRLMALYALHLEIERAPMMVSEAPLGEIRLQWWREAIEQLRAPPLTFMSAPAHPVIEAVKSAAVIDAETGARFIAAIDARARLLYDEPFRDVGDIEQWARAADGYLASAAARALGAVPREVETALDDAATAFALARHGAGFAPALAQEIRVRAIELSGTSRKALQSLSIEIMPAVLPFALTKSYLASNGPPSPLAKRWRLFIAMATGRI